MCSRGLFGSSRESSGSSRKSSGGVQIEFACLYSYCLFYVGFLFAFIYCLCIISIFHVLLMQLWAHVSFTLCMSSWGPGGPLRILSWDETARKIPIFIWRARETPWEGFSHVFMKFCLDVFVTFCSRVLNIFIGLAATFCSHPIRTFGNRKGVNKTSSGSVSTLSICVLITISTHAVWMHSFCVYMDISAYPYRGLQDTFSSWSPGSDPPCRKTYMFHATADWCQIGSSLLHAWCQTGTASVPELCQVGNRLVYDCDHNDNVSRLVRLLR